MADNNSLYQQYMQIYPDCGYTEADFNNMMKNPANLKKVQERVNRYGQYGQMKERYGDKLQVEAQQPGGSEQGVMTKEGVAAGMMMPGFEQRDVDDAARGSMAGYNEVARQWNEIVKNDVNTGEEGFEKRSDDMRNTFSRRGEFLQRYDELYTEDGVARYKGMKNANPKVVALMKDLRGRDYASRSADDFKKMDYSKMSDEELARVTKYLEDKFNETQKEALKKSSEQKERFGIMNVMDPEVTSQIERTDAKDKEYAEESMLSAKGSGWGAAYSKAGMEKYNRDHKDVSENAAALRKEIDDSKEKYGKSVDYSYAKQLVCDIEDITKGQSRYDAANNSLWKNVGKHFEGAYRGAVDIDNIPLVGGIIEASRYAEIARIALKKNDKQPLKQDEELLLRTYMGYLDAQMKLESNFGTAYRTGASGGESMAFMAEMVLFDAAIKGAGKLASKAGAKVLPKIIASMYGDYTAKVGGQKIAVKGVENAVAKMGAQIGGAVVQTGLQASTYANLERDRAAAAVAGREFGLKEIAASVGSSFIEVMSENAFNGINGWALGKAYKGLDNIGLKWFGSLDDLSRFSRYTSQVVRSQPEEYMEEYEGALMKMGLGAMLDDKDMVNEARQTFTAEGTSDMFLSFMLPGVIAGGAYRGAALAKRHRLMKKRGELASALMGSDMSYTDAQRQLGFTEDSKNATEFTQRAQALHQRVVQNEMGSGATYEEAVKKADELVGDYAESMSEYGNDLMYTIDEWSRMSDEEKAAAKVSMSGVMARLRNKEVNEEIAKEVGEKYGVDMEEVLNDPAAELRGTEARDPKAELSGTVARKQEAFAEYAQRLIENDIIEGKIAQEAAAIDEKADENGNVRVVKVDGKEYTVKKDNGDVLIVMDENGKKRQVSAAKVKEVSVKSAEEAKQEMATEMRDKVTKMSEYKIGDAISMSDGRAGVIVDQRDEGVVVRRPKTKEERQKAKEEGDKSNYTEETIAWNEVGNGSRKIEIKAGDIIGGMEVKDVRRGESGMRIYFSGLAMPMTLEQLQDMLEKQGLSLGGELKANAEGTAVKKSDEEMAEYRKEVEKEIEAEVSDLCKRLGVEVNVARTSNEIASSKARKALKEGKNVKGWYNTATKAVEIFLPNVYSVEEAKQIVFHEVVAHKGLRELLGDKFEGMCASVWGIMDKKDQKWFMEYVKRNNGKSEEEVAKMTGEENAEYEKSLQLMAADEYMAFMAEKVSSMTEEEKDKYVGKWQRLCEKISEWLNGLFKGDARMTNADIAGLIVRSERMMKERAGESSGTVAEGKDGEVRFREADAVGSEAFGNWFGGSKVVDENGEPLVMTHNTDQTFNIFDREKIGSGQGQAYLGYGFNFSRGGASVYGENEMKVYLRAEKPLRSDKRTLTRPKLDRIIRGIDKNLEDTIVSAWGGYSKYGTAQYERAMRETLDALMDMDDLSIYAAVCMAQNGNANDVIEAFKKAGYDSTIEYSESDGRLMNVVVFDANQVKSATENNGEYSRENDDIRFREEVEVTPEMDAEYMKAVESGDMENAEMMVGEAARAAGYNVRGVHGTQKEFSIFDKTRSAHGDYGTGFYFYEPSDRELAQVYAAGDAEIGLEHYEGQGRIIDAYIRLNNPLEVETEKEWNELVENVKKQSEYKDSDFNKHYSTEIRKYVENQGYDGIIAFDGVTNQIVVFDANQVKSADAVTYDDEGKVMPLSERFNEGKEDIRFREDIEVTRDLAPELYEKTGLSFIDDNDGVVGQANLEAGDVMFLVGVTFDEEERKTAIKELMAATGRSKKVCEEYLRSEETLANYIIHSDNRMMIDMGMNALYDKNMNVIWDNLDYPQGTVEFSNICKKRLPVTAAFMRLQKENPNIVFNANALETIRKTLKENGVDVSCALCFVEDRRQLLGEIANSFIKSINAGHPIALPNEKEKGSEEERESHNKKQAEAISAVIESGDKYVPTVSDLLTLDGSKKLSIEHPTIWNAFVTYNNARGMQAGRLFQGYAAYGNPDGKTLEERRPILGWDDAKVKKTNEAGGLRIFSFSDFEVPQLMDLVQIITDCAARGVKVQCYTKQPEFAKVIRMTNAKCNRSLIAENKTGYRGAEEGEGVVVNVPMRDNKGRTIVDKKGKPQLEERRIALEYDAREGININDVNFFDSSESENVGNILVGISDTHIRTAMLDGFVDYIIGFHSGQSQKIRDKKRIGHWTNYKLTQLDKTLKTNEKGRTSVVNADKHGINIYTDILDKREAEGRPIKNKKQFVEAFIDECVGRGWIPRFYQFLNTKSGRLAATVTVNKQGAEVYHPNIEVLSDIMSGKDKFVYTEGFHKLLIDFKMFDANGKILPQKPVVPKFDDAFNLELLEKYAEGEKVEAITDEMYGKIEDALKAEGMMLGSGTAENGGDVMFMMEPEWDKMSEGQKKVTEEAAKITRRMPKYRIGRGNRTESVSEFVGRYKEWRESVADEYKRLTGDELPEMPKFKRGAMTLTEYFNAYAEYEYSYDAIRTADEWNKMMDRANKRMSWFVRVLFDRLHRMEVFYDSARKAGLNVNSNNDAYSDVFRRQKRAEWAILGFTKEYILPMKKRNAIVVKVLKERGDWDFTWQMVNDKDAAWKHRREGKKVKPEELAYLYLQAKDIVEVEEIHQETLKKIEDAKKRREEAQKKGDDAETAKIANEISNLEKQCEGYKDRGRVGFEKQLGTKPEDVIAYVESVVSREDRKALWESIRKVCEATFDYMIDGGYASEEQKRAIVGNRWFYVPERGFAYNEHLDDTSMASPFEKSKDGRVSLAANPYIYLTEIAESAIQLTERNRTKQHMWNFLTDNKNWAYMQATGAAKMAKIWTIRVFDEYGNFVKEELSFTAPTKEQIEHDNQISARVKEIEVEIGEMQKEKEGKNEDEVKEINKKISIKMGDIYRLRQQKIVAGMVKNKLLKEQEVLEKLHQGLFSDLTDEEWRDVASGKVARGSKESDVRNHIVKVNVNGESYLMWFKDENMAKVLNGAKEWAAVQGYDERRAGREADSRRRVLDRQKMTPGDLLREIDLLPAKVTRKLSSFKTQFNWDFSWRNGVRDLQFAFLINSVERNMVFAGKVTKNSLMMMPMIARYLVEEENFDISKYKGENARRAWWIEEFMANGGETGYSFMQPANERQMKYKAEMKKMVKQLEKCKDAKDVMKWIDEAQKNRTIRQNLEHFAEFMSQWSELSTRLGQYVTERTDGKKTAKEAALSAKEITTNFNRQGELASVLGRYFMFYNATLQGTYRVVRSVYKNGELQKKNLAKLLGFKTGFILFGMFQKLANPDDPDEDTFVPDYIWKTYMKVGDLYIPTPHYFRADYYLGACIGQCILGEKSIGGAIFDALTYHMEELVPSMFALTTALKWEEKEKTTGNGRVDVDGWMFLRNATPSFAQPIVDVLVNRNYLGAPVYKTPYVNNGAPLNDVHMGFSNTPDYVIRLCGAIQDATGKMQEKVTGMPYSGHENKYETMGWDINPTIPHYIIKQYGGGVFDLVFKIGAMPFMFTEDGIEARNIPFVGSIYKPFDRERMTTQYFWDIENADTQWNSVYGPAKRSAKKGEDSRKYDYMSKSKYKELHKRWNSWEFREIKNNVENNVTLTDEQLEKLIEFKMEWYE